MHDFTVNPLDDKSQWPVVDPGFNMRPPKLETSAGRPRKRRIKSSGEPDKRGPYQCKRCFQFGHIERTCDLPQAEPDDVLPAAPPRRNKEKKMVAIQEDTCGAPSRNTNGQSRKRKKVADAEASSGATTYKKATTSPNIKKVAHKRAATKKSLAN